MLKKIINHWAFWLFLVISIGAVGLVDLTTPGVFVGHDTKDHVVRIAHFYNSLSEGVLIPRWSSHLNWGYGHPVMMFLYPLPSYVASIFLLLGVSYEIATEWVFALGFVGSGVSMWLWVRMWLVDKTKKQAFVNELAGVTAAVLYMYAPYRFVDLYVRGAIGENFFFMFPPLVLLSFLNLVRTRKLVWVVFGALFVAGMLLSHNALSIMYIPFIGLYWLGLEYVHWYLHRKRGIKNQFISLVKGLAIWILGFGLASFFWIPAFFEGKYTLRDIVTENVTLSRFETIGRILYSPWSYHGHGNLSVQLGLIQWTLVGIGVWIGWKVLRSIASSKYKAGQFEFHSGLLTILSAVFLGLSLFLMLEMSRPIYETITLLQKFQFPWRWLSLALFMPAIYGGLLVCLFSKKHAIVIAINIVVISLFLSQNYWTALDHTTRDSKFYSGVYKGTTDTGESSPIWSIRFMERSPANVAEVIDGEGSIAPIKRTSTFRSYNVVVISDSARILENTLYFPGWTVYVDGEKLLTKQLSWQDPNHRGLITYELSEGAHRVEIVFEDTLVRRSAGYIAFASGMMLLAIALFVYIKK